MTTFKIKLFYSYCHADKSYREDMQTSLALLKRNGGIDEWHDKELIAGQHFSSKIKEKLEKANIVIFLVSRDFLASDSCVEEWNFAKKQTKKTGQKLISIIIRECAWKDFDNMSDYLALPENGKPVTSWNNKDEAWQSVYDGIKNAVEDIRKTHTLESKFKEKISHKKFSSSEKSVISGTDKDKSRQTVHDKIKNPVKGVQETFTLKPEFKEKISSIEFVSSEKDDVQLEDLFVFPNISLRSEDDIVTGKPIKTFKEISKNKHTIIRGEDQSGKTVICKKFFLHLVAENKPVIFVNLNTISGKKPQDDIFKKIYMEQFNGDYSVWKKQKDKTIILDNLSGRGKGIEYIPFVKEKFENVFVATSNDSFYAYFKDEKKLATFTEIEINYFKSTHQEQLIKNWMGLNTREKIEDGKIDQIENMVNSIIISNRILPRYPFFILSILQTQEAFMPSGLNITLYGHCYHALVIAQLIKSKLHKDVDPCFNFLRELAFFIYKEGDNLSISEESYDKFELAYGIKFIKQDSIVKKLHNGIINKTSEGFYHFYWSYSYYFFLGQYLAKNISSNKDIIEKMIEKVYLRDNSFSLIFTIHHADDIKIIEDILAHTICTLDEIQPAKLDSEETKIFSALLKDIPQRIISEKSVEEERMLERENRDIREYDTPNHEHESPHEAMNELYKLLKNMEILSQILKNKSGSLEQDVLANIVEIISDAGLRLIRLLLLLENGLDDFFQKKWEEKNNTNLKKSGKSKQIKSLEKLVRMFLFVMTINAIEKCVYSINKKEIAEIVKNINEKKNTPAYDLIYYFYSLNTADRFEDKHKKLLEDMISKNKAGDGVLIRILSIKTQIYFNTHRTKESLRQSVLQLLNLPVKQRVLFERVKRISEKQQ